MNMEAREVLARRTQGPFAVRFMLALGVLVVGLLVSRDGDAQRRPAARHVLTAVEVNELTVGHGPRYVLAPSLLTVRRGDTVILDLSRLSREEHEPWVTAPDGRVGAATTFWDGGRMLRAQFVAKKLGTYQLTCSTHAPTMAATVFVLPE